MSNIHIEFFLNDEFKSVEVPFNTTALEFIRNYAGLTGTKLGCGEGDCGTCTVALGTLRKGKMVYKAVNSCLVPVAKLHHKHVVTVEGISDGNYLHPVQEAILENHATQCGFCTPGITMSLFSYFAQNSNPDEKGLRLALEGNLCRCTGYKTIKKAAEISMEDFSENSFVYPSYFENIRKKLEQLIASGLKSLENEHYFAPESKKDILEYIDKHPDAVKISGGTDLMVLRNLRDTVYPKMVDVSEPDELQYLRFDDEKIEIGGSTVLSDLLENKEINKRLPVLQDAVELMASRQIRNLATISGNIANASPIADTVPVLMVCGARLHLASAGGVRTVLLEDFYHGYKKTELAGNEIIEEIEIPLLPGYQFSFEKSSKRKAVDISTVNSALAVKVNRGIIQDVRLAYGGIAPVPVRLFIVEDFLKSKRLTEDVITEAALLAAGSVKPITDMRGSETYRKLLVKNHLIKHFHKLFPEII